jgi:hypothetical protein
MVYVILYPWYFTPYPWYIDLPIHGILTPTMGRGFDIPRIRGSIYYG